MTDKKTKSTTSDRGIKSYPPPYIHRLVKGYAEYTGQSESSVCVDALKGFFDKIPPLEKDRILLYSKNGY